MARNVKSKNVESKQAALAKKLASSAVRMVGKASLVAFNFLWTNKMALRSLVVTSTMIAGYAAMNSALAGMERDQALQERHEIASEIATLEGAINGSSTADDVALYVANDPLRRDTVAGQISSFRNWAQEQNNAHRAQIQTILPDELMNAASETGIPLSKIMTFMLLESDFRYERPHAGGSARGLLMYQSAVWQMLIARNPEILPEGYYRDFATANIHYQHNPERVTFTSTDAQETILSWRHNPRISIHVWAHDLEQRRTAIRAAGRTVNDAEEYMVHVLGAGRYRQFMRNANRNMNGAVIPAFANEARQNRPLFYSGNRALSYGEVITRFHRRVENQRNNALAILTHGRDVRFDQSVMLAGASGERQIAQTDIAENIPVPRLNPARVTNVAAQDTAQTADTETRPDMLARLVAMFQRDDRQNQNHPIVATAQTQAQITAQPAASEIAYPTPRLAPNRAADSVPSSTTTTTSPAVVAARSTPAAVHAGTIRLQFNAFASQATANGYAVSLRREFPERNIQVIHDADRNLYKVQMQDLTSEQVAIVRQSYPQTFQIR